MTTVETSIKEKEYQFKRQENGKFKAFVTGTDTLLEGFEDKEFGSPLEGGWFFKNLAKEINKAIADEMAIGKGRIKKIEDTTIQDDTPPIPDAIDGSKIQMIEVNHYTDQIISNSKEKFFEIILHENDESKKTHAFVTDGVLYDFYIKLDEKAIVPAGVVNVVKEAVYTIIENHYDAEKGRTWNTYRDVPRYSMSILREVSAAEAKKYLIEQKKLSRAN